MITESLWSAAQVFMGFWSHKLLGDIDAMDLMGYSKMKHEGF